ncbi:MAG: LD-carboxypeptidase [Burkholderiales bacterium RIFOXYC12_FULL_65_23]|uniref:LD-carboxypeptidase n=1 Tax=Malikia spinosa TaxID=86180 RepID=UPI0008D1494C|nr:MAG: LD-carboxypeptidase [Burkholderiales bacterium RIFOXYC12_FULL_65_23]
MAHIYIYSPSGAVRDKAAFRRGVKRLQARGHEVEIDADALSSHQRFAGDDDTRLAAIGRAAASGAQVALISRGGYGLTRLLPRLPYAELQQAVERGTHFVGLSDFTALQLALLAQNGTQTWAGPALLADFGVPEEPDEIMQDCFDDLLVGQGEGTGWRLPLSDLRAHPELSGEEGWGVEQAQLWGGNLSVLVSLLGTPYFPQIEGGILFLEDVAEHPYRIERMLTQLLHAGVLGRQQAVLLGQFNRYQLVPHDKGFKLQSVVDWLRSQLKVPVLTGLPFGHVPTKVLLPVGARLDLAVSGREAILFWD